VSAFGKKSESAEKSDVGGKVGGGHTQEKRWELMGPSSDLRKNEKWYGRV